MAYCRKPITVLGLDENNKSATHLITVNFTSWKYEIISV